MCKSNVKIGKRHLGRLLGPGSRLGSRLLDRGSETLVSVGVPLGRLLLQPRLVARVQRLVEAVLGLVQLLLLLLLVLLLLLLLLVLLLLAAVARGPLPDVPAEHLVGRVAQTVGAIVRVPGPPVSVHSLQIRRAVIQ